MEECGLDLECGNGEIWGWGAEKGTWGEQKGNGNKIHRLLKCIETLKCRGKFVDKESLNTSKGHSRK